MTAIHDVLHNLTLGAAQFHRNLTIMPLLAPAPGVADYLTLDEAQDRGLARVTEVSDAGSVPTLLLENDADVALFLLDGEELVGAKQNRILNLTLLVPAKTSLEIPVSCVEQGRWSHRSEEFASADRALFSRGRARKAAHVSENLRAAGSRRSNQGEVWADIEEKMSSLDVCSATDAISDAYEHHAGDVDNYVQAFHTTPSQAGACFAVNGQIIGMELFDMSSTCEKLMPRVIRSYALDAIEQPALPQEPLRDDIVRDFLGDVAEAPLESYKALGEGDDLRIHSDTISGGALAARARVVHVCAFLQEAAAGNTRAPASGRMQSVRLRRRRYGHD